MKHHRQSIAANACALAALLCVFSVVAGAQVRQIEKRQEGKTPPPQASQELKVGKFTGRSAPKIVASNRQRLNWQPLSLAQLRRAVPGIGAVTPYADLSPANLAKPGRAYVSLEYAGEDTSSRVFIYGLSNQIFFLGPKGTVTLNVKRSAPGKVYIADCAVGGGSGSQEFKVEGGGRTETWPNQYGEPGQWAEIHIVLSIIPANDDWYEVSINNTSGWAFYGCRVMEY